MASETLGIDEWLQATLTGDATITGLVAARVFAEYAPQGTVFPCIVYRPIDTEDIVAANATRIMVTELRLIEAICEGQSYTPVKAIAERIDVLLHRKPDAGSEISGAWSGVTILSSDRQRISRLAETEDGRHYRRLGGIYRISAQ